MILFLLEHEFHELNEWNSKWTYSATKTSKQLFGEHILLSSAKTEEKEQAKALAREQAQRNAQEAAQKRAGVLLENGMIPLSQRERRIVERLNQNK
jgi:predicted transcriptional regulator of viral defense system